MSSTVRIPVRRALVDAQLVVDGLAIKHEPVWTAPNGVKTELDEEMAEYEAEEPSPIIRAAEPEEETWEPPQPEDVVSTAVVDGLKAAFSERISEMESAVRNLEAQLAQRNQQNTGLEQRITELMAKLERQQQETEQAFAAKEAERTEEHGRFQEVMKSLEEVVEPIHQELSSAAKELRQAVPQLSVAIASRLLHERIAANDFPIEALVGNLVSRFDSNEPILVSLHPDDVKLLREHVKDDLHTFFENKLVRLTSDPKLLRGDCSASSGELLIASRLADQLAEIQDRLLVPDP